MTMVLQTSYILLLALLLCLNEGLGNFMHMYSVQSDHTNTARFDGLGGISGGGATSKLLNTYPDKYKSDLYDLLFKPSFGASLQILKVEMGGGAQTTEGTELSHMPVSDLSSLNTNSYEWEVLQEAVKRNPKLQLIGLPWSFPGWVSNGTQNPFIYPDRLVPYFISWLDIARKNGLHIDYLGIWNEPPQLLYGGLANFTKQLRRELDRSEWYKSVKLIVGEQREWNITEILLSDKEFYSAVHILSSHYPGEVSDPLAKVSGKTLWASEDYSTEDNGHGAACLARVINRNFVNGGMTCTIAWNMIASYYNSLPYPQSGLMTANQPWSGHYSISPPLWVIAHTTQFTEVGWRYLPVGAGSYNLKSGGTVVSYINSDKTELTIVVETMSHKLSECVRPHTPSYNVTAQNITFNLSGTVIQRVTHLRYWQSKITASSAGCSMMIKQPDLPIVNGMIHLSDVPVNSLITLTTLTTGQKGEPVSPIPDGELFPLIYSDNFEPTNRLRLGSEAKYFTPQTGTFQLARYRNRSVLMQTTQTAPVEFCSTTPYKSVHFPVKLSPVTVIPHNAYAYPNHSYSVSAEMAIGSPSVNNTGLQQGMFIALYMSQGGCHVPLSTGLFFVFNITNQRGAIYNKFNFTSENLITGFEYPFKYNFDSFHNISILVVNNFVQKVSMDGIAVVLGVDIPKSVHGSMLGLGCNGFYRCMYDSLLISPVSIF